MKKLSLLLTILLLNAPCAWTQDHQPTSLRILVVYDASASMGDANITPPTRGDLRVLADAVAKTGGDIAYTLVTAMPEALTRLHIEPPPPAPILPTSLSNNPFIKAKEQAGIKPKMDEYHRQLEAHQAATAARIQAFLDAIANRHVPPARASNINAALDRASIFFSETNDQPTTNWLLLICDGADTTGRPLTATFAQSLQTIVVHRSSAIGIFTQLNPRPAIFESVESAVQTILRGEK